MIRLPLPLAAAVAGALLLAPSATAGTYTVNACAVGERVFPNQLLTQAGTASGTHIDTVCDPADTAVNVNLLPGSTMPDNSATGLRFTAPAGTTIAGFDAKVRFLVDNTDTPGHNPYVVGLLGSTPFAGAGHYTGAGQKALTAQGAWYGGASDVGDSKNISIASSTLKALSGYDGSATTLEFRLGCVKEGSVCDIDAARAGGITRVFGLQLTLNDVTAPSLAPAASGLLGGGAPAGSTPVTVNASDAAGIKTIGLLDVTDPARPTIVGGKTYDPADPIAAPSNRNETCTFRAAHACPDLAGEPIVPTALTSGVRQIVVRAADAAGNTTDAGPYRVDVSTPSDRGARNGTNATDAAKLTTGFTSTKKGSRTVDRGSRPTITGTLTNDAGTPVAGAALTVYTRDTDAASYRRGGTVTTGAEGRYAFKAKTPNSRYVRVVWVSYVNDTRTAATDVVKLRVRAGASLTAPRSVRVGSRFALRGRLRGTARVAGVPVVAEAYEQGRFRTFKLGRTAKNGRFKLASAFESSASRGRSFRMRVRILGRSGFPYTSGMTRTTKVRVR